MTVDTNLDVFEVDFGLLAKVDDRPKEVEESLVALERLKHVNQRLGAELVVVLGRNLDNDLQVLPYVGREHRLETLERVFHRQGAKERDEPLGVQHVGVDHGPLDVVQVGVVFEGALEQASLLAQLGNVCPVVVGEHLVAHDGVRNLISRLHTQTYQSVPCSSILSYDYRKKKLLVIFCVPKCSSMLQPKALNLKSTINKEGITNRWGRKQVQLEQASLQGSLRRPVVLQSVQEECSALLDHVCLHEHVNDLESQNSFEKCFTQNWADEWVNELTWLMSARGSSS